MCGKGIISNTSTNNAGVIQQVESPSNGKFIPGGNSAPFSDKHGRAIASGGGGWYLRALSPAPLYGRVLKYDSTHKISRRFQKQMLSVLCAPELKQFVYFSNSLVVNRTRTAQLHLQVNIKQIR